MSASKRKAIAKRDPTEPSKVTFQFFAATKNGRDLIFELARLVPTSMKSWGDAGAPVLNIKGGRAKVLAVRAHLLRDYPDAVVRIFEVPAAAHASWMFAEESDFVRSADGFTFVIPGDTREPPKPPTRRVSAHDADLFRRACAARRWWKSHGGGELHGRRPSLEMSAKVVDGDLRGYILRDVGGCVLARLIIEGDRLRFLGHGRG